MSTNAPKKRIFVIALNLDQAKYYVQHIGADQDQLVFLNTVYQIQSLRGRGLEVIVYGPARQRADYRQLINACKKQGFAVRNQNITEKT